MPLVRPLFWHLLQPKQQRREKRPPLLLQQRSFRSHDPESHRPPLIEPEQLLLRVLHLHPEPHPVLVSQRLPVLLPQRHLCLPP